MDKQQKTPEDDFWDLSHYSEKKTADASPFASRPTAVSFFVNGKETERIAAETKLTVTQTPEGAGTATESYVPSWSSYLQTVTLQRKPGHYDFFKSFSDAAKLYFDRKGEPCDFVQFYSYMPQYSQMNERQKAYYFYFRSSVREGVKVKTDYSYVYLLVSEIVNLPDRIEPQEGLEMLFRIWKDYRADLPKIDCLFPLWIEDYCLIHRLPCPYEKYELLLRQALSYTQIREFYFSVDSMNDAMVLSLCNAFSSYDFRFSKMIPQEKHREYVNCMIGALSRFFCLFNRIYSVASCGKEKLVRDAFRSLVCSQAARVKLQIEYLPLVASEQAILTVTNAVKYAENKMRAIYSIKSRLGVKFLPEELMAPIDAYFASMEAMANAEKRKVETPAYLALYDAPREEMSTAGADEIEFASWATTARLVEEEAEPASMPQCNENLIIEQKIGENAENSTSQNSDAARYLLLLYEGKEEERRAFMREVGLPEESFVSSVNDMFADSLGDVVIALSETGYSLIQDYREDVASWLKTNAPQR